MSLTLGPVVFIDDQVNEESSQAFSLAQKIRDTGRPIAAYEELPPQGHAEHWRSLAFVIVDWDLVPGSPGQFGGTSLSEFHRSSLLDWIREFSEKVYCPIFIVSHEDTNDIEQSIDEGGERLSRLKRTSRLKVFAKDFIIDNFIDHVESWVLSSPALAALNIWENDTELAINRLFNDMDELEPEWPVYVWESATEDGVNPSFELASVISANLQSRTNPAQFDSTIMARKSGNSSAAAMRRVLHGRTMIPNSSLHEDVVLPGDLFQCNDGYIWVNVMPACHTVSNRKGRSSEPMSPSEVRLLLVRGEQVDKPASKSQFSGLRSKHDNSNGMLIHALHEEYPYAFKFKVSQFVSWGDVSNTRIGRLVPPYITLLQQKHSEFLMNEGIPKVSASLYDDIF